MTNQATKLPVAIIAGFLGSGKTTLLSRMLSEPSMSNTAVLVNEFGKVGLDHHLLRQVNEHTVLIDSGCACCNVREDLVKALLEIYAMSETGAIERLERVVIETSGLADPAPILFSILTDPVLQHHFFVESVITVVDAASGQVHLDRHPESVKQVVCADEIVITKTDLVTKREVNEIAARLRRLNPSARIIRAAFGEIDMHLTLLSGKPNRASTARAGANTAIYLENSENLESGQHLGATRSFVLTFRAPIDWRAFGLWLSMLLHAHGEDILRVKGLIDVNERGPVVLNGVQHIIHPPQHLNAWPDAERVSQLVFITRGIEPQDIITSLHVFLQALEGQVLPLEVSI